MIKGVSITSPRDEVSAKVLDPIVDLNANWVTLLPYGYSRAGKPKVVYNSMFQWWGGKTAWNRRAGQICTQQRVKSDDQTPDLDSRQLGQVGLRWSRKKIGWNGRNNMKP